MRTHPGCPIVLTADRTLTAGYKLLFDGMLAASQTSSTPPFLLSALLMPPGGSRVAPLGQRRIEAALISAGFAPEDIAVTDERGLAGAIGPNTRIVGITSGEPTGLGMNSSTMTCVAGGHIYPEVMFRRLLNSIHRRIKATSCGAKVVLGGAGAWQLAGDESARRRLGIDHVVVGYAEANAAEVFRGIMSGDDVPDVIQGMGPRAEDIPPIRACSTMGVVELSRGCGLGCDFCTIARVPMIHLPEETILADVRANLAGGIHSAALLSEDFFRYGANGMRVNPRRLISLLESLRSIDGLGLIQTDHSAIYSVSQFSDDDLRRVRELMVGDTGCRHPWLNVGVETAADDLLRANGGAPKMSRVKPGEWGKFCACQLHRLCRAGFMPMASLMIGLPGESRADIERTLDWVESVSGLPVMIFPMLHAPIDGSKPIGICELHSLHWDLVRACYRLNFRWTPRMYWDNQKAVGVSVARRILLQLMGRGQVLQWNAFFALHSARAPK